MKLIGTSCSVRSHWSPCFQPVRTDLLLGWWNERISQEAEFLTLPPALPVSWLQTNRNPLISVQEWSICVQLEQCAVHEVTETGSVRNASLPAARPFIQRSNMTSERWCTEQRKCRRHKSSEVADWYCHLFTNYLKIFQGFDAFKWYDF
jgi:hypothetical protein